MVRAPWRDFHPFAYHGPTAEKAVRSFPVAPVRGPHEHWIECRVWVLTTSSEVLPRQASIEPDEHISMHPALRVRHRGGWLDRPAGSTGEADPEVMPPISKTSVSLYVTDDRRRLATAPLLCLNSEILTTIRREFLEG
jgi:hypothetical protein